MPSRHRRGQLGIGLADDAIKLSVGLTGPQPPQARRELQQNVYDRTAQDHDECHDRERPCQAPGKVHDELQSGHARETSGSGCAMLVTWLRSAGYMRRQEHLAASTTPRLRCGPWWCGQSFLTGAER